MYLIPSYHRSPIVNLFDDLLAFEPRLSVARTAERQDSTGNDRIQNSDNHVQVSVDVPGVKLSDLQVSVKDDDGSIHIVGRRSVLGAQGKVVKRSKIERRLLLNPHTTDLSHIKAHLVDGVLTLEAPKKPKVEARTIPILVSSEAPVAASPQLKAVTKATVETVQQDTSTANLPKEEKSNTTKKNEVEPETK